MDKSGVAHGLFGGERSPDRAHAPRPHTDPPADPLLPGYPFDLQLVAGTTPIVEGGALDFTIDRPQGMKGWVIHLTVRGRGQVFDDDEGWACERGELSLFAPSTRHCYRRAADSDCWFHRWVYFQPRGFWSPWLHWPDTQRGVGRLRLRSEALFGEFEQLFAQVEASQRSTHRMAQELATNQLERLLLRSQEEAAEGTVEGAATGGATPAAPDSRVQAACRWINQHLADDLSLDEVAREVHLSPSRLAQLFREQTGLSLLRWREDQRLQMARHLLQTTGTPVSQISAMVGYDDQLYFSRVFRKRMGVSPTEFRRKA